MTAPPEIHGESAADPINDPPIQTPAISTNRSTLDAAGSSVGLPFGHRRIFSMFRPAIC